MGDRPATSRARRDDDPWPADRGRPRGARRPTAAKALPGGDAVVTGQPHRLRVPWGAAQSLLGVTRGDVAGWVQDTGGCGTPRGRSTRRCCTASSRAHPVDRSTRRGPDTRGRRRAGPEEPTADGREEASRWVGKAFPPLGRQPVVSFVVVHDDEHPAARRPRWRRGRCVGRGRARAGRRRCGRGQPRLAGLPRAQHHPARGAWGPRGPPDAGVPVLRGRGGPRAGRVPVGRPRREPPGARRLPVGLHLGVRRPGRGPGAT